MNTKRDWATLLLFGCGYTIMFIINKNWYGLFFSGITVVISLYKLLARRQVK